MQPCLLDACVALNLIATRHFEVITRTLGGQFMMIAEAAEEVSYLEYPLDSPTVDTAIQTSIRQGSLAVTPLRSAEIPSFVDIATQLGDGEAATLAAARQRGMAVATDDRKARRVASELGVELFDTPSLLREFVAIVPRTPRETGEMLLRIERHARYRPSLNHPHSDWWSKLTRLANT